MSDRDRSPRRAMCSAVLFLEAITVALSAPVMIAVDDVSTPVALSVGLGLGLVCLLLSGMLRKEWAYSAGHVVQVGAVGLGFLAPFMFFLGPLFALLWGTAYGLGRKIEREKAAAYAAFDAQEARDAPQTPQP